MNAAEITRRIEEDDYTVQSAVEAAGPAAAPVIAPLLAHADEDVRMLAAHCLALAGGPVAAAALLGAALDPSLSVAAAALKGLEEPPLAALPGVAEGVLGLLGRDLEPALRRRVPTVLLAGGGPVSLSTVKERWAEEPDEEVKEGLSLLLAKLGDDEARARAAERVARAEGDALFAWARLLELVRGPWLVPALATWLDREAPARRIGVDGVDHIPEYLRACDVAVNALVAWTGVAPSFPRSPVKNYAPAERDEVARLIAAWRAARGI